MKLFFSISPPVLLLLVFTAAPNTTIKACGKDKCSKETTQHQSKCQANCCKKPTSDSKKQKKGCCGDDCTCTVSIMVTADLPQQLPLNNFPIRPAFNVKSVFFYKQVSIKSTIQDIWQPPISLLSI